MKASITLPSLFGALLLTSTIQIHAQAAATNRGTPLAAMAPTAVPEIIPYSGIARSHDGKAISGETSATFLIFKDERGGEPLWTETQPVAIDGSGHYQVQLGASSPTGLPAATFASGEGRWLEVQIAGQEAEPRVLLASVPYAMKAAEAETLGGLPSAEYVTQAQLAEAAKDLAVKASPLITPFIAPTGSGATNYIPLWTSSSGLGDSYMFQAGPNVYLGSTTAPSALKVTGDIFNTASGTYPTFTSTAYNSINYEGPRMAFNRYEGTIAAPAVVESGDTVGFFDFFGYDGGTLQRVAEFAASVGGSVSAGIVPGQFGISTANSSGFNTPRLIAYPNDNLVMATHGGNVGIGTLAPTANLEVNGTAKFDGNITFASTQTFPVTGTGGGTITAITSSSPLTGSGTSGTVALGLNTAALTASLEGTFDSRYGMLSSGYVTFSGEVQASELLGEDVLGGIGTYGASSSSTGASSFGVYGDTENPGAGSIGVFGLVSSTDSQEYLSQFESAYAGVWGDNAGGALPSLHPVGVFGTADNGYAGAFINSSATYPTLFVSNNSTGGKGLFKTFMASSGTGTCGVDGGSLSCTGQIKTLTPTAGGSRTVETYAVQSPENWMEDFGAGTLHEGAVTVALDPAFAETISAAAGYHVFLTPKGDSKGLYVTGETATGFEVRESGGGHSSIDFDYRIVAKRAGLEALRLVDVTEKFVAESKPAKQMTMVRATQKR